MAIGGSDRCSECDLPSHGSDSAVISPNGALVAFSHALPSPSVITASVTSPGHSGDPNFHSYTPDAVAFPVWKWDNSQFWAATAEATTPAVMPAAAQIGAV